MGKTHMQSGSRGWSTTGKPMSPTSAGIARPILCHWTPGRSRRYMPQWFCCWGGSGCGGGGAAEEIQRGVVWLIGGVGVEGVEPKPMRIVPVVRVLVRQELGLDAAIE